MAKRFGWKSPANYKNSWDTAVVPPEQGPGPGRGEDPSGCMGVPSEGKRFEQRDA